MRNQARWRVCFLVWLLWVMLPRPLWAASLSPEEALSRYVQVKLAVDLSGLSVQEQKMVPLLIEAASAMNEIFWQQTYGPRESLFSLPWTPAARQLLLIHFGPWDRMEENRPLFAGLAAKPLGAAYYPADMTKAELESAASKNPNLKDFFSLVKRDSGGGLIAVPYHQAFHALHALAADRLRRAAELATEPSQARYLSLRAEALLTDRYRASDEAWMEMKGNRLEIIIGPIETYDDGLMGLKAAHEGLVLLKDRAWEYRLARYIERLGAYQSHLPTTPRYRAESPALESDLGVYDALLMTGDAAVTRPIAINLPNDEQVQLEKGSRRLQLRNVMQAKFDKILLPMAKALLDPEQVEQVRFESLFINTLFHEVAHGLGIKKTIDKPGTVNDALQEDAWMMEEGKADALSLLIGDHDAALESEKDATTTATSRYVTEFASLFRAIRFGASSSHGRANLIRFNYFQEQKVFVRSQTGRYHVDMGRMKTASQTLADRILRLQGDGDQVGVRALEKQYGTAGAELLADLQRVEGLGIPVDVVFAGQG